MVKVAFSLLASLVVLAVALPPQNPIIGVYTMDAEDFGQQPQSKQTYISASYVKNLEMAGAQVVPLYYHYSHAQLDNILSKINGVFFPGGEMPIASDNEWTANIAYIFDYANRQNDRNNPFPIWATCLGYEAVMYLFSGRQDNMTVLTEVFGQKGLTDPLIVKTNNSVLIKSLSVKEYQEVTTGSGLLWFHHRWAVTLETYQNTAGINSFWKLVSTSKTGDGVEFVSTVEAVKYPYLMTQYHPEKNSFEWHINASRTYSAVSVEQKFINQFVKIARLSSNRFTDENEWTRLSIYNFQPLFTPNDADFIQVYLFDESQL
jgi:gamma-glutamyl hydrolase